MNKNVKNRLPSTRLNLIDSILSEKGEETLKKIVDRYPKAFVLDDNILGHYNGPIKHRIDLKEDAVPFKLQAYRIPYNMRKEVEKQIEGMLEQNIIIKSASPFASPIVLVPKKNKQWRMAVDYRKLNALTKKSVYFLPHIQDSLDLMSGKTIYSTFDLASGFHQIDML